MLIAGTIKTLDSYNMHYISIDYFKKMCGNTSPKFEKNTNVDNNIYLNHQL